MPESPDDQIARYADMLSALGAEADLSELVEATKQFEGNLAEVVGQNAKIADYVKTLEGKEPEDAIYTLDSQWAVENHGVDPDVDIENLPADLLAGHDAQLGVNLQTSALQYSRLEAASKSANVPLDQTRALFISLSTAASSMVRLPSVTLMVRVAPGLTARVPPPRLNDFVVVVVAE